MNTHLRQAGPDGASSISALVHAGFIEHVAPDWESSAQQDFLRDTASEKLTAKISEATFVAVYVDEGQILGVIFMPRPTLVQLFFVAPSRLRSFIGRTLWEAARTHLEARYPEVATVELNSSPYAVAAYKALGFFPISEPFCRRGAAATRMACWLPGRSLKRVSHVA